MSLQSIIQQIKTANLPGENTALRVGSALEQMDAAKRDISDSLSASDTIDMINAVKLLATTGTPFLGTIDPATVIPAGDFWAFASEGVYVNAGGIVVEAGEIAIITRVDTTFDSVILDVPVRSIQEISKISTVGVVDTYRIYYTDTTYTDFEVTNANIASSFDPLNDTEAITAKDTAEYLEGFTFSNPQTIGATAFDTPFSIFPDQEYFFNRESFSTDKYVSTIKMHAETGGNVVFVFGKVVNEKFIERKTFTFDNFNGGVKTYAINDILQKGESYGVKTPSTGMAWKTFAGTGILWSTFGGYNTTVLQNPNASLAIEMEISDFVQTGYTPIGTFNNLKNDIVPRVAKLESYYSEFVTVGKTYGDYNSIKDAVYDLRNNTNPITIIVFPGIYEGMIDLFTALPFKIKIVAAVAGTVTVIQKLGDYNNPPMQVNVESYFEGINFISTSESGLINNGAYSVHVDFGLFPTLTEFFNCKFLNKISNAPINPQAFGSGAWNGNTLRLRMCDFENEEGEAGALLWHTDVESGSFNQRLEVLQCNFRTKGGIVLEISDARLSNNPSLSSASVLFVGNSFKSNDTVADSALSLTKRVDVDTVPGALVGNILLDSGSHGNNIIALNY